MFDTAAWQNFFIAEVGAAAALVGLLFVSVSINLAKILAVLSLPGRALEALIVLVLVLLVATVALVPGQASAVLGAEIVGFAALAWVFTVGIQHRASALGEVGRYRMVQRVMLTQLATLPMIAGGVSLLVGQGGGLYWLVPGVIGALLAAVIDAWVLLVEIQR